jgi:hypothetical protein
LGHKQTFIWEEFQKGTSKGFSYCKAAGLKQGLSENTVKQFCVERHAKTIPIQLGGRAGYQTRYSVTVFSGIVTNDSPNYIVTSYTVTIDHQKAKGGGNFKQFSGRWIEPKGHDFFDIQADDLKYVPQEDDQKHEFFNWKVISTQGIEISF